MKELMDVLGSIEKKLDEVSVKLPQLPQNVRDLLVKLAPYFSILGVALSGLAILVFLAAYVAFFGVLGGWMVYGTAIGTGVTGWIEFIAMIAGLLCNIKAIPGLFARSRDGWLWLFYAELIMAVRDVASFQIGGLIGVAIGLYFLFQMKGSYRTVIIAKN